jgi:hypothetical protein
MTSWSQLKVIEYFGQTCWPKIQNQKTSQATIQQESGSQQGNSFVENLESLRKQEGTAKQFVSSKWLPLKNMQNEQETRKSKWDHPLMR